jgi:hypothetical protein
MELNTNADLCDKISMVRGCENYRHLGKNGSSVGYGDKQREAERKFTNGWKGERTSVIDDNRSGRPPSICVELKEVDLSAYLGQPKNKHRLNYITNGMKVYKNGTNPTENVLLQWIMNLVDIWTKMH